VVKASFSEDAANTVIDPASDGDAEAELLALADAAEFPEVLPDPQPATADAATPTIPAATRVSA